MPLGVEATVPLPVPALVTVTEKLWSAKFAVTLRAALIDTVQLAVPVQAPLHPANLDPVAGVAVRVTLEPPLKLALHVVPQLMPAGFVLTLPLPRPALVTLSV
jgi:hypothetical protein